jgi:hypothetical protein
MMQEGMAFNTEITNLIASNLSQYRQNIEQGPGNPITATEFQGRASEQARLQKTQTARYYKQMDSLYAEIYRRASYAKLTKSMMGAERALEFQKRCERDGVPAKAMQEIEFVRASRVVGQGSEFLRQQSVEFLFATVLPRLPENGQANLISDVIASRAGQTAVERYYPKTDQSTLPDDQYSEATQQVAGMKVGVPPVTTASQNPVIYSSVFLEAMTQAVQTLQQGGSPQEVAQFMDLAGQAVGAQLQRMAGDKTRQGFYKQAMQKLKELGQIHDQLTSQVQQRQQEMASQQQQMMQQRQSMNSELMLAKQKQDAELMMKNQKNEFGMAEKGAKTRQAMALKDAMAAQNMRIKSESQNNG